jgi:Ca2+-binding EF-hand superfamily protein
MSLDKYEFSKAMQDYMLGFSEGEIAKLFTFFDYDRSGLVEYDEFIRTIRGPMNPARKAIVAKAFAIMDKDKGGFIDINDMRGVYNAAKHPDVTSGKKTEQQILQEFLETFETAHNMRNNDAPDYIVTKEEFEEYYNNVSASIDSDEYFSVMMNSAWNLDNSRVTKKGWKADEAPEKGGAGASKGGPARSGGVAGALGGNAKGNATAKGGAKDSGLPPMNYTEA